MADLSDVLSVLASTVSTAVYPNGTGQPSVTGTNIRVFPGWPDPNTLDADLAAGNTSVSIYPTPTERNTTRYPLEWQQSSLNTPALVLTVASNSITVGGSIVANEAAVVIVNGLPYAYGVQAGDTTATIAAALAALIPGSTVLGSVVTVTAARTLTAMVSVQGVVSMEVRRQERLFQITIWAPTPDKRDIVAKAVDIALAQIERFTLQDNTSARLIYQNSPQTDQFSSQGLFRRDLIYSVEYATTVTTTATEIAANIVNLTAQNTFNSTL